MTDEAIVFKTRVDNKTLEQQLKQTTRKFENMRNKLEEKKNKKLLLEDEMRSLADQAADAEKRIEELKKVNEALLKQNSNPALPAAQRQANIDQMDLNNQEIATLEKKQVALAKSSDALYDKWQLLGKQIKNTESSLNGVAEAGGKILRKNNLVRPITDINKGLDATKARLAGLAKRVLFFSVFASVLRTIRRQFNNILKQNDEFRQNLAQLKGAVQVLIQPLLDVIIPAVTRLVEMLTKLATTVATMLGNGLGKSFEQIATQAKKTNQQARNLAGFDELNVIGGNEEVAAEYEKIEMQEKEIENYRTMLEYVTAIAAGFLAWKISESVFRFLGLMGTGTITAAIMMLATGITLVVLGFREWIKTGEATNKTLIMISAGLLLIGGAIALLTGAWIPLIIAAVAALVVWVIGKWDEIKAFFIKAFERARKLWKDFWQGIKDTASNAIESIKSWISGLIDKVKSAFSWIGKLGNAKSGGTDVEISSSVPRLATGAVIPPNREFLATLGDNKSETEVVSPLSTIQQALENALANNSQNIVVNVDGKALFDIMVGQNNSQVRRSGRSPLLV